MEVICWKVKLQMITEIILSMTETNESKDEEDGEE